jgi:integrase/recombinase XerD
VGEAIRLTVADVQLTATPPHLIIRETKFAKSRLVPLHATAAEHLRRYGVHKQRLGYDALSDAWLISEQGGPLLYSSLWIWFARFLRRLNIRSAEGPPNSVDCWWQAGATLEADNHARAYRTRTRDRRRSNK